MKLPLHVDWDGARRGARDDRAPIVLLHGFAGDGTAWAGVRKELRALGPTLTVDLIGHGQSPAPDDWRRYTMAACLDDLEAVMQGLGLTDAWWLGYSMGGRVALQLAVHKPHLVRGLVLESATAGITDPEERAARVEGDRSLARAILEEGMAAFVDRWLDLPMFDRLRALPDRAFQAERERRLRQRPEGLARSLEGMGAGAMAPVWDRLGEIEAPVLAVVGDEDERFCDLARRITTAIPGSRMYRVPQAGHAPHSEKPRAFLSAVTPFIREHEQRGIARSG